MSEPRITVDGVQVWPTPIACFKAGSCHLTIEPDEHDQFDLERLHAFAASIGMRRSWFQNKDPVAPHYDLTPSRRTLALRMGAVFVPWREQAVARIELRKRIKATVRRVEVPR
jgi:hypothetical protein